MLSPSRAWARPSSQNAMAKLAKSDSPVRLQKRRNSRPATRKPIAIAPDRKLNSISVLPVPDEAVEQHADRGEGEAGPDQRQIDLAEHQQIEDDDEAVACEEQE